MRAIGVDPGADGAIAVIDSGGVRVHRLKTATEADTADFLRSLNREGAFAIVERVSSSPQMGVVSAFKFGGSFFSLRMALTAFQIPFDLVSPAVWQRKLGCLSKGDKNVTKSRAQQLFPDMKIVHGNADAILLAEYCRRFRQEH